MNKKFGAITSSTNSDEIANRIKGLTLTCSALITYFAAKFFGLNLTAGDIASLATQLGVVAGAVWTLYGFGMSVWAFFFKKT